MALPGDLTTFTLTFGHSTNGYTDSTGAIALVGAKVKLWPVDLVTGKRLVVTHVATGQVIVPVDVTVTIDAEGKATVGPLPHTDNPTLSPVGFGYHAEWQVVTGSHRAAPRNKTFAVPAASGATVDFDLLDVAAAVPGVLVPMGVSAGVADAAVSALLPGPSLTQAAMDGRYVRDTELDAQTAALVPGAGPTAVALRATFVAHAGLSNDTDDTAKLQGLLDAARTASGGGTVRGLPGTTYLITAPLVVGSNTHLDMTGCTVRLKPGSDCPLLRNRAYGITARGVVDGVTTAASTTLTSATAAFGAGDVGKRVRIHGVAANGGLLDTTIASVTNATTAVLTAAPATSATDLYVSIGTRDANIRITGGIWDKGNNQGPDLLSSRSGLALLRVDNLQIDGVEYHSTAGKYAMYLADVEDFSVRDTVLAASSDGVHVNGPAANGLIDGVFGTCGDDAYAFLEQEGYAQYDETRGRAYNLIFRNNKARSTTVGTKLTCSGKVTLGALSDVVLDGCDGGVRMIGELVAGGIFGSVRIANSSGGIGLMNNAQAFSVRNLAVVNHRLEAGTASVVGMIDVRSGVTVDSIVVDQPTVNGISGVQHSLLRVDGATAVVDRVSISGASLRSTGTDARLVTLHNNATLRYLNLNGVRSINGGSGVLINVPTGATLLRVDAQGIEADHSMIFAIDVPAEINVMGATNTGNTVNSVAAVVVKAIGMKADLPPWIATDGTSPIRSRSFDWSVDVAKLAKVAGGMAHNNNGARSCGVGPVVCDGATWKNLHTGATY